MCVYSALGYVRVAVVVVSLDLAFAENVTGKTSELGELATPAVTLCLA